MTPDFASVAVADRRRIGGRGLVPTTLRRARAVSAYLSSRVAILAGMTVLAFVFMYA